jgi:hypothetical protein
VAAATFLGPGPCSFSAKKSVLSAARLFVAAQAEAVGRIRQPTTSIGPIALAPAIFGMMGVEVGDIEHKRFRSFLAA